MPRILTTKAIIQCPHGGLGTTTPLSPFWQIDGGFVLAEGDSGVLTCPFFYHPCVGYKLQSMGLNSSMLLGRRVILETDMQQSFTGLPLAITETHFCVDDSVPAPIPAGEEPSALEPSLTDILDPQVQAR